MSARVKRTVVSRYTKPPEALKQNTYTHNITTYVTLVSSHMTCVPTALLRSLRPELERLGVRTIDDMQDLVRRESGNVQMVWVAVNGLLCTVRQQEENRTALSQFTSRAQGQLVSTFDPLIIFMVAITRATIVHTWSYLTQGRQGGPRARRVVKITYAWKGPRSDASSSRIVHVKSTDRHMWA